VASVKRPAPAENHHEQGCVRLPATSLAQGYRSGSCLVAFESFQLTSSTHALWLPSPQGANRNRITSPSCTA
jgi:hypothetical protein